MCCSGQSDWLGEHEQAMMESCEKTKMEGSTMKKKAYLVSTVAAAMLVSAACSNGNNAGGSSSETPSPTQSTPAESAAPEKVHKISGITYIYGNPAPNDGEGLKKLNEKFNVDYFVEKVPAETYPEKLSAVVSSGSMPDMIGFEASRADNFPRWAKQGAFLELNDYIDQYPSLKAIPDELWAPFTIDGKIYGIPSWSPTESSSFYIRKDWLDNLGLPVPTNYEELASTLIAFTNDDPDKNGNKDTYGMAIGQNINPNYAMGPYWQFDSYYHQDEKGNYIPGMISQGRKELIEFFNKLYQAKALTPDFAVINWADTNNEFYSSKAGLFLVAPRGMSQDYMTSLLEISPDAEFAVLPPFLAPDGSQGFVGGKGYARFNAFNAKLKDDPEKLKKILDMHEFSRQFYPMAEQNASNADHDWFYGGEGAGYEVADGKRKVIEPEKGSQPYHYFQDNTAWVLPDQDPEFESAYTEPKLIQATTDLVKMSKDYKQYFQPNVGVVSETEAAKGAELMQFLMNEQTKMIVGQRPISDWDAVVNEYLSRGGSQIIEEYNAVFKERGYTERRWK
jgi:putative aldouronate transport system substrate-binding protein